MKVNTAKKENYASNIALRLARSYLGTKQKAINILNNFLTIS